MTTAVVVCGARPVACLLALLAGCSDAGQGAAGPAPAAPVILGAEDVAIARSEVIMTGPRIAGSLAPEREAVIRAQVGGQVLGVDVELGQSVSEGELLARLERGQANAQASAAGAAVQAVAHQLELSRRDHARIAQLVSTGALPRRELENAESAIVAAQARLTEARAHVSTARDQVGDSAVRAPFAGVVAERAVNEGDVVGPGSELFTILDPSAMLLAASVPAEDVDALAPGTPVHFAVRGYPGEVFTGTLRRIAPSADRYTRQIRLLIEIPNANGRLIAHLFAEGRVVTESRPALVVPRIAVDESGATPQVTRVRNDTVERVAVVVGLRDDVGDRVEILEGLQENDVVLVRGARSIVPGTAVTRPPEGTAQPAAAVLPASEGDAPREDTPSVVR